MSTPDQYVLRIHTQTGHVHLHPVRQATIRIGRAPTNDVVLDHTQVSEHHAIIHYSEGQQLTIEDAGSRNSTLINQHSIPAHKPYHFRPGDRVTIGPFTLEVAAQHAAPASYAGAASSPRPPAQHSPSSGGERWRIVAVAALAVAIVALLINGVLLLKLNQMVRASRPVLISVDQTLDQALSEGLHVDIPVSERVPISATIPFNEDLVIPINETFTLDEVVETQVTIPVVNRTVTLRIPIKASVPVNKDVPIHVEKDVHIDTTVAIDTVVPITVRPGEWETMGDLLRDVQEWLKDFLG